MQFRLALRATILLTLAAALVACSDSDLPGTDAVSGSDSTVTDGTASDGAAEEDCSGKSDGTACGPDDFGGICLKEQCVTSSCGDDYVDSNAEEECEDGNEVDNDGCTRCKWDCSGNDECDDGNACNGDETCDTDAHTCEAGTPPGDDTVCTQPDEEAGVCRDEVCVAAGCGNGIKEDGEDCDDDNEVSGDGCEGDCTWTCQEDVDCDDQDKCTGAETCDKGDPTKPVCKPGTAVTCTSDNCEGTCEPSTGDCVYADVDRDGSTCDEDCNDANPAMYPGASECSDGIDNDCDPSTTDGADGDCKCYVDKDDDTYAAAGASSITSVTCPDNYTSVEPADDDTIDCRDTRVDVFPGNRGWYSSPYCVLYGLNRKCLKSSWDYNCSKAPEKRYTIVHKKCVWITFRDNRVCLGSGWAGLSAPECGVKADYTPCLVSGKLCSAGRGYSEMQECH